MGTTNTITIATWIKSIIKNDEGCHNTISRREKECVKGNCILEEAVTMTMVKN
jgi:hypothetical protein